VKHTFIIFKISFAVCFAMAWPRMRPNEADGVLWPKPVPTIRRSADGSAYGQVGGPNVVEAKGSQMPWPRTRPNEADGVLWPNGQGSQKAQWRINAGSQNEATGGSRQMANEATGGSRPTANDATGGSSLKRPKMDQKLA
jgi:hypothetical protein